MRLTGNKVLLTKKQEKTESGIYMPDTTAGKRIFEVAAIGPGMWNPIKCERVPMTVKPGDRVAANLEIAPEIEITKAGVKQKYYIIPESDIQYVLEEGEV